MRGLKKVAGIAAMAVMLMCNVALAAESGTASEEIVPKVNDGTKIVINLASRGLYLYEQVYPEGQDAAAGRDHPTLRSRTRKHYLCRSGSR